MLTTQGGGPAGPPEDPKTGSHEGLEQTVESAVEAVVEDAAQTFGQAASLTFGLVGGAVVAVFSYLGEVATLLWQAIRALRHGINTGDLVRQMSVIGVDTIPIALMTVGFSGAVLALYSVNTLKAYGVSDLVGGIVSLSIVRESGPILAGVVAAARAGSAMTAEIGSMKVSEQVDALRTMGISPIEYLVVPRVLASLIMVPLVTVCADFGGVIGGGIVASSLGVSWPAYLSSIRQLMDPSGADILKGLVKTLFFGVIVAVVGCREGLETEGGAAGVGQSTTRSVVLSIVLIFAANFALSFLLFQSGLV
jgi:phospholipid/cholesterol/gamma-HCH transport system permease protein